MWMCFDSSINSLDKHSIQCIACFDLRIDSVDNYNTPRQFLFQTKVSTCKLSEATKHCKEGFLLAKGV